VLQRWHGLFNHEFEKPTDWLRIDILQKAEKGASKAALLAECLKGFLKAGFYQYILSKINVRAVIVLTTE